MGIKIFGIIKLDYKSILKNRSTILAFLVSMFFFFLLSGTLVKEGEHRSSIPIGITDYDNTIASKNLIQRLCDMETIFVYENRQEELEQMLEEESIAAIFEINQGFEKKITTGITNKLMNLSYLKGNTTAILLADLVAGEFMYELCLGKSFARYQKLDSDYEIEGEEVYRTYVEHLKEKDDFKVGFAIEVVNKTSETQETLENQLLYKQMILGFMTVILSFFTMFLVECIQLPQNSHLNQRIQLTEISKFDIFFGHILVILSFLLCYGLASAIFMKASHLLTNWNQIGIVVITEVLLGLFYALLFVIIKYLVKNSISYQWIGGMVVLFFGSLGFIGILLKNFLFLSKIIPNYWFIQTITDILL